MFTVGDPRLQAISQAGASFGTGLGNILNRYVEGKAFNKAFSQGISPETSPYEIMQKGLQAGVSPDYLNMALSPTVQQRAVNQQAYNQLQQVRNNPQAQPNDYLTAILGAQALSGNYQGVSDIINRITLPNAYSNGMDQNNQMAAPNNQIGGMQPGSSGPQGNLNAPPGVKTVPYTPAQKQQMRYQASLIGPAALTATDQKINDVESQYNVEKEINQRRQDTEAYFDKKIGGTLGQNPKWRPEFESLAKSIALTDPSVQAETPELTFDKVRTNYLTPIMNKLHTVENKIPTKDVIAKFDNPQKQKSLKGMNTYSKQYIDLFPENQKRIAYDTLRRAYRNKTGVGAVSAEYAIDYPDQSMIKELKSLGENPQITEFSGSRFIRRPEENNLEDKQNKLSVLIKRWVSKGASPIVMKDLVVDSLGYPDNMFDEAMDKAVQEGLHIPDYMQTAYDDTKLLYNRDTAIGLDKLGGRTLVGPWEMFK